LGRSDCLMKRISKLKDTIEKLGQELANERKKVLDAEHLKEQLEHEREKLAATEQQIKRSKACNKDETEACRHKEGELLDFTERLTSKTVQLQAEHNSLEQKSRLLEEQFNRSEQTINELNERISKLEKELSSRKKSHESEIGMMAKKLAEKKKLIEELRSKVDELENENKVMKKRHVASLKELNKELLTMKRRLDPYEANSATMDSLGIRTDSSSRKITGTRSAGHSRTSSSVSLEALNQAHTSNTQEDMQQQQQQNVMNGSDLMPETMDIGRCQKLPDMDMQMLVEKIIKLQKELFKKNEKIDFLEEHNQQLTEEIKRKSKLLQYHNSKHDGGGGTKGDA